MRVLVACEYSGRVREAFARLGHDVMSCDILPTEQPGNHYQGSIFDVLDDGWDLLIGHPPCTFLTNAGVRWLYHPEDTGLLKDQRRRHPSYPDRMDSLKEAADFFNRLKAAPIPKIALENSQPHGVAIDLVGRYTQKVQPWMFGEPYTKGACLWLKGLPELVPTNIVSERIAACHKAKPGPDRWKERSRTYQGIADAMAAQWGGL